MMQKITERAEFKTAIYTAWDGSEQRMALRAQPQRFISYDYIGAEAWQSQYMRMMAGNGQTTVVELPLWHAGCVTEDEIYNGQSTVKIRPECLWGYYNIGAVELWTSDKEGGRRYPLSYITASGTLGLGRGAEEGWPHGILVAPVARGVLRQNDAYANVHSEITTMTVNLELLPNQNAPALPEAYDEYHDEQIAPRDPVVRGLPEFYMGIEIFRHEPPWLGDAQASYMRNANRLDNETGIFLYDLKSNQIAESRRVEYVGISRAEIHNLQRFFFRKKGRLISFWAPTWLNDLELSDDAAQGQIFIFVKFNLYFRYCAKDKRRRTIAVFHRNGTCNLIKIVGYALDDEGARGKVYLDSPLKKSIIKNQVAMISYLCRCRFAADSITTDYETPEAASIELEFTEVDE